MAQTSNSREKFAHSFQVSDLTAVEGGELDNQALKNLYKMEKQLKKWTKLAIWAIICIVIAVIEIILASLVNVHTVGIVFALITILASCFILYSYRKNRNDGLNELDRLSKEH